MGVQLPLCLNAEGSAALTQRCSVCLSPLQDFDPPSEGQVRGHEHLLTMLTKMDQGASHRGERPQPEVHTHSHSTHSHPERPLTSELLCPQGSWGREEEEVSAGEVRNNPTTEPYRTSMSAQQNQTPSPGQVAGTTACRHS